MFRRGRWGGRGGGGSVGWGGGGGGGVVKGVKCKREAGSAQGTEKGTPQTEAPQPSEALIGGRVGVNEVNWPGCHNARTEHWQWPSDKRGRRKDKRENHYHPQWLPPGQSDPLTATRASLPPHRAANSRKFLEYRNNAAPCCAYHGSGRFELGWVIVGCGVEENSCRNDITWHFTGGWRLNGPFSSDCPPACCSRPLVLRALRGGVSFDLTQALRAPRSRGKDLLVVRVDFRGWDDSPKNVPRAVLAIILTQANRASRRCQLCGRHSRTTSGHNSSISDVLWRLSLSCWRLLLALWTLLRGMKTVVRRCHRVVITPSHVRPLFSTSRFDAQQQRTRHRQSRRSSLLPRGGLRLLTVLY